MTDDEQNSTDAPSRIWRRIRRIAVSFAVLLVLATVAVLFLRVKAYNRLLGYDPAADYQYRFTRAASVSVELSRNGFAFPKVRSRWDTAFLKLSLAATGMGRIVDPTVHLACGPIRIKQYLERGARGVRYLNVSALSSKPPQAGEMVRVEGRHISWQQQEASLLLFDNEPIDDARILVISPHPDDAEIAAFGLYSTHDSHIVTVTAGDAGDFTYERFFPSPELHYINKGKLRAWDSVVVPLWGGVPPKRCINMGYFDCTLPNMFRNQGKPVTAEASGLSDVSYFRQFNQSGILPREPREATWPNLVADVVRILEAVSPTVIVTPHPFIDKHADHQFATFAVLQALPRTKLTQGRLFLYTNHHVITKMHPLGLLDGVVTLPPRFDLAPLDEAVFSFPLTAQKQIDKIFALEAMHALRPPPSIGAPKTKARAQAAEAAKHLIRGSDEYTYSHLRRAVRPNELFLVLGFADASRLAEEFLASVD